MENIYFIRTLLKKGLFLINNFQFLGINKTLRCGDFIVPSLVIKHLIYKGILDNLESNLWFIITNSFMKLKRYKKKQIYRLSKVRYNTIVPIPNYITINYNLMMIITLNYNIKQIAPFFNKTVNSFFKRKKSL